MKKSLAGALLVLSVIAVVAIGDAMIDRRLLLVRRLPRAAALGVLCVAAITFAPMAASAAETHPALTRRQTRSARIPRTI